MGYSRLLIRADPAELYCTLDQIALELGVTRERVRQIEARAIRKLAEGLAARGYRLEDLLDLNRRYPVTKEVRS